MTKDDQDVPCLGSWLNYKGIENFFRRVAFNLGNTPSKTEVKIVSCIPIDVTDLQERIASLEKQLDRCRRTKNQPAVLYSNENYRSKNFSEHDIDGLSSGSSNITNRSSTCACKNRSKVSVFTYDMELNHVTVPAQPAWAKEHLPIKVDGEKDDVCQNKRLGNEEKEWFRKQRRIKNEPLIYYAETKTCSPFSRHMRHSAERRQKKKRPTKTYLDKVMSKQYKPKVLVFDRRSTGELSVPMCRDTHESLSTAGTVESDLCSCCYGNFQNIDKYIAKPNYRTILEEPSTSRQQCYYDDKFYDVVPVKENTDSDRAKDEEKQQQKINMQNVLEKMDMLCKPSEIRPKLHPVAVNYHTITPNRNWNTQRLNGKQKFLGVNKNPKIASRHSNVTSCSIECGGIYAKNPGIRLFKSPKNKRPIKKYADLETIHVNKNQEPPKRDDNQLDMKTEETLKQIKSILITVLSEVKSNSQNQPLEKGKRDVVIQKGLSQSDMLYSNSGVLQNVSYGPYGMNPYMVNSQVLPNMCYPMTCPLRYTQNYPILVQPQPRPLCASCYKPRSKESQQFATKRIISAATNTADSGQKRTTETEHLIKEIYKSMALGPETPIPAKTSLTRGASDKSVGSKSMKNAKTKIDEVTSPFVTSESKSVTAHVNVTPYREDKKKRATEEPPASDIDGYKEDVEEESETDDSTVKSESAESESTVVQVKDKSKGLFNKMLCSILKKKKQLAKKKSKRKKDGSDEDTSDSDDYQTIYSQEIPTTSARRELRRPAKTTYSHSKRPIPLRKPEKKYNYFKDEDYRRQWAMKLAERENRRYIERPKRVESTRSKRNIYEKNYETLQALMQYRDEMDDGRQLWDTERRRGVRWTRSARSSVEDEPVEKTGWLKRHKLGLKCLPEWKKLLFER